MMVPCDSRLDQCVRHSEEPNGLDHDLLSQCSRFGAGPGLIAEAKAQDRAGLSRFGWELRRIGHIHCRVGSLCAVLH